MSSVWITLQGKSRVDQSFHWLNHFINQRLLREGLLVWNYRFLLGNDIVFQQAYGFSYIREMVSNMFTHA